MSRCSPPSALCSLPLHYYIRRSGCFFTIWAKLFFRFSHQTNPWPKLRLLKRSLLLSPPSVFVLIALTLIYLGLGPFFHRFRKIIFHFLQWTNLWPLPRRQTGRYCYHLLCVELISLTLIYLEFNSFFHCFWKIIFHFIQRTNSWPLLRLSNGPLLFSPPPLFDAHFLYTNISAAHSVFSPFRLNHFLRIW